MKLVPPLEDQADPESPELIDRDRAHWYARGFIQGNPVMVGLLLSHFDTDRLARLGGDERVGLSLQFGEAFAALPHGDIELGFAQWMAAVIDRDPPNLRPEGEAGLDGGENT